MMRYYCRPGSVSIVYGSVDESQEALEPPKEHIFVQEKASWFELPEDGATRHEKFDPPFHDMLHNWKKNRDIEKAEWS